VNIADVEDVVSVGFMADLLVADVKVPEVVKGAEFDLVREVLTVEVEGAVTEPVDVEEVVGAELVDDTTAALVDALEVVVEDDVGLTDVEEVVEVALAVEEVVAVKEVLAVEELVEEVVEEVVAAEEVVEEVEIVELFDVEEVLGVEVVVDVLVAVLVSGNSRTLLSLESETQTFEAGSIATPEGRHRLP